MPSDETKGGRRLTKNEKRRLRLKAQTANETIAMDMAHKATEQTEDEDVKIEYVSAPIFVNNDPLIEQFMAVFEKFAKPEELTGASSVNNAPVEEEAEEVPSNELEVSDGPKSLSKKKKKLASRLSVAELKQLVQRPDVVEAHDVTSSDPRLLVFLKAYRNTVPVPRHWCHKRKYLQGKRGIEKPPFQLPEFIADTGIAKIRESVLEQEALKKSKQKARDRLQPKMGKIDIDYQVLHDAFFKYQKKPKMTGHGDLYYEGKEFEVNLKEKKPGQLSAELKQALGMSGLMPPPWLINMQRYGPPPSYPSLKIPGLSAPLPEGAAFGYHPGGWGKPPVDEYGQPLYGDVFGMTTGDGEPEVVIDRSKWGELTVTQEEYSEEEDAASEESGENQQHRLTEGQSTSGMETPQTLDGISSMISGMETPDAIDLRKRAGIETPGGDTPRELYHVIKEKSANISGSSQLFGSDRTYVLPGRPGVEISINPDSLEDQLHQMKQPDILQDAYETQLSSEGRHEKDGGESEDLRGKRKRRADAGSAAKRHKDFKF